MFVAFLIANPHIVFSKLPADYPGYYTNIVTIRANVYRVEKVQNGWLLEIGFKFTPPDKALYTIVIFSKPAGIS